MSERSDIQFKKKNAENHYFSILQCFAPLKRMRCVEYIKISVYNCCLILFAASCYEKSSFEGNHRSSKANNIGNKHNAKYASIIELNFSIRNKKKQMDLIFSGSIACN